MNTRQSGSEGVVAKMGDPTPAGSQDPGGDGEVSRQIPNYRLVLSSGSDVCLDSGRSRVRFPVRVINEIEHY